MTSWVMAYDRAKRLGCWPQRDDGPWQDHVAITAAAAQWQCMHRNQASRDVFVDSAWSACPRSVLLMVFGPTSRRTSEMTAFPPG